MKSSCRFWIQHKELKMKVTIIIKGGSVQAVQKDAGVELNIIDFDVDPAMEMKYESEEEVNEIDFDILNKMNDYQKELRRKLKPFVVKKIIRAVVIAKEIDRNNFSNIDEYDKIINYLKDKVGFEDGNEVIQKWD